MIEKIYIPTVNRTDNQITYSQIPEQYLSRVVFVVQAWEKHKYQEKNILVLPEHIHFSKIDAIAQTRQFIYKYANNQRYGMLDDDLIFIKRNAKYWSGQSNMPKSYRACTRKDMEEMILLFDSWLDKDVAFCGCSQRNNPPGSKQFCDNSSMSSVYFIDGPKIADIVSQVDFTDITIPEDVNFILTLLTRGKRNRVSMEFCTDNISYNGNISSDIWSEDKIQTVADNQKRLAEKFPGIFNILNQPGGYRNIGKTKILWSKAFKYFETDISEFFV